MKRASKQPEEMRAHYDFSKGVRGKYAAEYAKGSNVVVIAPELIKIFPDSQAVNEALRTLMRVSGKGTRVVKAPKKQI